MATITERKGKDGKTVYRVQIRMKGHAPESETFTKKTDAKRWAQDVESAIRDGRHFKTAEAKKHTLGEMIDRYMRDVLPRKSEGTSGIQKPQLEWWKSQIGVYLLSDVTPALLVEQRDKLMRTPIMRMKDKNYEKQRQTPKDAKVKVPKARSTACVNRYLAALSHVFTVAVKEWGWVDDTPMRKISKLKENNAVVRFLSDEERNALLKACKESSSSQLYAVVVLALSTGARKMEVLGLRWKDVDTNVGVIRLTKTKNKTPRAIPLQHHALHLVKEKAKLRRLDTDLLFPGENPKAPVDLRKPWAEALQKAKIENFRFHDLRHSAASYLAMNGATLAEIAEVLGHKTLAMVKRYAHLSEQHTLKVVANMNEKIFGANI